MLVGEKVRLRLLEPADLRYIVDWRNKELDKFFSPWPLSVAEQDTFYQRYRASGRERIFIIDAKVTAGQIKNAYVPIGTISLVNISPHHQTAEVGRVQIGNEEYRKGGYMREALKLLVEFAFQEINLYRLEVRLFEGYGDAKSLYKECGFVTEATLRGAVWKSGEHKNIIVMSALRDDWREARKHD